LLYKVDVPVYANKAEIPYATSGAYVVGDLGRTAKGMNGGDVIELGDTEVKLLHTPGHTPGSQCVQVGNHLITGDTLFIGGCGRADLPGGDAGTLLKSLQKIAQLPSDLEICPGHDYGDAPRRLLRDELKVNPYLRIRDEDDFITAMS
jgi:glyoxylase-like metal-dependent hydrolase (beta-lactamase superfamily II)